MDFFDHDTSRFFPNLLDFVVMGSYLILMFMVAYTIKRRKEDQNPAYRYYVWGLLAKVVGAIAVCMVYTLYYTEGADTNHFFRNSSSLVKLFLSEPAHYFRILFGDRSPDVHFWFTSETGWPWMFRDPQSFVVVRITSIFTFFAMGNFYTTTILVSWFSYTGIWRLYLVFCKIYPTLYRQFAWAVLFLPSLVFWGSGILKDTYAIMALGWFTYSFYHAFIIKEKFLLNSITLLLSTLLILFIKPYILVALTPGVFIWLSFARLRHIQNPVLRAAVAPAILTVFTLIAFVMLRIFSDQLGVYGDLDTIILKAQITQDDMMRAYAYSENYFDIGKLDGTLGNFLSKTPLAINATLFRPYLWEARNLLMGLSALENTLFIVVVLLILWRTGPIKGVRIIANEPLLIFSLLFTLAFAFGVGVSTANFGALVRLRVPLMPFFTGSLVIMQYLSLMWKREKNYDVME